MRKIRCDNCGHEVTPEKEYHDRGKVFCSTRCREYYALVKLEKNARLWGLTLWAFAFIAVVFLGALTGQAMAQSHHQFHEDFYRHWMQPTNPTMSCCNARIEKDGTHVGDCEPTQAKLIKGDWWAWVRWENKWVQIPDEIIVRYPNPNRDNAHICFNHGKPLCFKPPDMDG